MEIKDNKIFDLKVVGKVEKDLNVFPGWKEKKIGLRHRNGETRETETWSIDSGDTSASPKTRGK